MPEVKQYFADQDIPGAPGAAMQDVGSAGSSFGALAQGAAHATGAIEQTLGDVNYTLQRRASMIQRQQGDDYVMNEVTKNASFMQALKQHAADAGDPNAAGDYGGMSTTLMEGVNAAKQEYTDDPNLQKRPDLVRRINQHLDSMTNEASAQLASLAAQRTEANSSAVLSSAINTGSQIAFNGDFGGGVSNAIAGLMNYRNAHPMSDAEFDNKKAATLSQVAVANIQGIINGPNPENAMGALHAMQNSITATGEAGVKMFDSLQKQAQTAEMPSKVAAVADDIMDKNPDASPYELVRILHQDPRVADNPNLLKQAETELRSLSAEKAQGNAMQTKKALADVNDVIGGILEKGGTPSVGKIPGSLLAALNTADPTVYAHTIESVNSMAKADEHEAIYKMDVANTQASRARTEAKEAASDRESAIMADPNFQQFDVKGAFAQGQFGTGDHAISIRDRLLKAQQQQDPMKQQSVIQALHQIDTGSGFNAAIGAVPSNELGQWRLKYHDVIKAWAANNWGSPTFDRDLTTFMSDHVLNDFAASWFHTDETDRTNKLQEAQSIAGPSPASKGSNAAMPSKTPAAQPSAMPSEMPAPEQYKGRTGTDTATGKRYLSDGSKWVEVK